MLPPVWCASHVVGEKPPQAAWDRPWVPWEGCRPRRAFPATWLMPNRWHGGWLQPDLQSLISATMTIRLSLTASSPHSNAGHAGGNPID